MARSPRINFPDAVYHVTSRGNGRASIFFHLIFFHLGIHYGGISASAVSNIRRRVRERQDSILPVIDRLLATIREAEFATAERA